MRSKTFIIITCCLMFSGCSQSERGILYQFAVFVDGERIASPTLAAEFNQSVQFQLRNDIRFELNAKPPEGGLSVVEASIFLPEESGSAPVHRFESGMALGESPSFQYTSQSKKYRINIYPRNVWLPANRVET